MKFEKFKLLIFISFFNSINVSVIKKFSILNSQFSIQKGFTLLEILVVFSVIAILSGVGFGSFVSYSRTQQLNQTANNVKLLIIEARSNAISTVKSSNIICDSLQGYSIEMQGDNTLNLIQNCVNNNPVDDPEKITIKKMVLPKLLTFDNSSPAPIICGVADGLYFNVLSSQVSGAPCSIKVTGYNGVSKSICVDLGGNPSVKDLCQ